MKRGRIRTNKFMVALAMGVTAFSIVAPITSETANASIVALKANETAQTTNYKAPFTDVAKTHIYYDILHQMRDQGIITGYDNGTFKPDVKITRQHAAVLIQRATSLTPKVAYVQYKDISNTHPYFEAIKQLQQTGVIKADAKGNFNASKELTRGEMALILANAFKLEAKAEHPFNDVSKTSDEGKAIAALYEAGITTGYDNGTFKPNESLSRAHYAVFLYRSLNYKKDEVTKPVESPTLNMNTTFEDFKKIVANDKSLYNIDPNFKPHNPVERTFKNERFRKMLVEGAEIIKKTDYQFKSVGADITLEKPNFVNTLPEGYMSSQITITKGINEDMTFHVDYTDPENVETAKQFLAISYPDLAKQFEAIIDEKSTVARNHYAIEKDVYYAQRTFQGNLERFDTKDFDVQIGVDAFMWYFSIDIKSK